ncbi:MULTISPECIES: hypothetical protein [Mesorhizobium]|nr:hypothetical protein [Mesorhizobium loti]
MATFIADDDCGPLTIPDCRLAYRSIGLADGIGHRNLVAHF